MADTCAKCGALVSTSGSCDSCGSTVAADPDQAIPTRKSRGTRKVLLITLAIVAGIGILGAGALGFAAWRNSKVVAASNGNEALFSIPGIGSISTGSDAADPSQLGAPVYPGAVQEKGAISIGTSKAAGAEAHFTSSDPISQVEAFYASNLPGAVVAATASGAVINAAASNSAKDRVTVTITRGSGSNAGKTTIVIVRTTKN